MNGLFGLRVRVTVGERLIVGVATATAVFLLALPPPQLPMVTTAGCGRDEEKRRMDAQKLLQETHLQNKICYGITQVHVISLFKYLYSLYKLLYFLRF